MLLLLLTGSCVYVCMYVYIYIQKDGFVWLSMDRAPVLLLAQRLRQGSVLWQALSLAAALSFSPAELIKMLCHLPWPTLQPFGPSDQAELLPPGSSCILSSLWGRGSSSEQEQALGTCISCLLNLRYEEGHGRARVATGSLLLATLWTANTAGSAVLGQLQFICGCVVLLLPPFSHPPDEHFIKAKPVV